MVTIVQYERFEGHKRLQTLGCGFDYKYSCARDEAVISPKVVEHCNVIRKR